VNLHKEFVKGKTIGAMCSSCNPATLRTDESKNIKISMHSDKMHIYIEDVLDKTKNQAIVVRTPQMIDLLRELVEAYYG